MTRVAFEHKIRSASGRRFLVATTSDSILIKEEGAPLNLDVPLDVVDALVRSVRSASRHLKANAATMRQRDAQ